LAKRYQAGDIIRVEVDFKEKLVRYLVNDVDCGSTFPLIAGVEGDGVYPSVSLYNAAASLLCVWCYDEQ
jgi:hypothetical protein